MSEELFKKIDLKLDMVLAELRAIKRKREPKVPAESEAQLCESICAFILEHYQEHKMPFNSGKISRIFAHRLHTLKMRVADVLRPAIPHTLHMLVTEKGAAVYVPAKAWLEADESLRNDWYTMTEREYYKFSDDLRRLRQGLRERDEEIEQRAEDFRKRVSPAMIPHGLPESESAFEDLTVSPRSDTPVSREQFGAEKKRSEKT